MAENLLKMKPQPENPNDDLEQVRDILVGALVSRIDSSIAEHEKRQASQNELIKNKLADQKKSIDSLGQKLTRLSDNFKEHVKSFKSEVGASQRSITKVGNDLAKTSTRQTKELEDLDERFAEALEDLQAMISNHQENVQQQITDNAQKLDTSKVERQDLSQMLANIATMIGNEKPGTKD